MDFSHQSAPGDDNQVVSGSAGNSYVDDYNPPAGSQVAGSAVEPQTVVSPEDDQAPQNSQVNSDVSAPSPQSSGNEALEDQNIFELLGVLDGTPDERESFLDELQQVIWEDFLGNDVELLVTEEEMEGLRKITDDKSKDEAQVQESVINYLEKLIPDLEEIMLEKALELKEDMVRERITGMREYYAGRAERLEVIDEAERLIEDGLWKSAADKLNTLTD